MSPTRTIDEISKEIEDVAFNGEGADKLRALKMLREDRGGSAITLPDPMADGEMVSRLARMMKGCGRDLCHAAFSQAFPQSKSHVDDAPVLHTENLSPEVMDQVQKVRTLKALYKRFPTMKRPGFPPGYPAGRGAIAQQEWCRRMAAKCFLDQAQKAAESKAANDSFLEKLKDAPVEVVPHAEPIPD